MSAQIDTIRTKYRQLENNRETNAQWLEEMKQRMNRMQDKIEQLELEKRKVEDL